MIATRHSLTTPVVQLRCAGAAELSSGKFEAILMRFNEQEELVLQPADLSLRTIANMVASGAIDLAPNFQRRERWQADQQSGLIESFLLNIPVPPIYLAEDDLGTYPVIDGKQRITAVTLPRSGSESGSRTSGGIVDGVEIRHRDLDHFCGVAVASASASRDA